MKIYSVAEFRKNMRQVFNDAEAGEVIEIERYGRIYQLVITPFNSLKTDEVSSNIRPDVPSPRKIASDPQADTEGWKEAGSEMPCCSTVPPCKHWQWDQINQDYRNTLSGRRKEPTLG